MSQKQWMIYGANGFTGALAARDARARGERPVLAGRHRAALESLGDALGLPVRVFDLADAAAMRAALMDITAVLCCAGPFRHTTSLLLPACAAAGVHYVDITGELDVFEWVHARDGSLREAGIVALPGAGFDVVPSDCLAAQLARELPDARDLRIAFKSSHGKMGPGTAKTMLDALVSGARVRRDGHVVHAAETAMTARFAFEDERYEDAVAVSWGDVCTAYVSTGIPNISCFVGLDARAVSGVRRMPALRPLLARPLTTRLIEGLIARLVKGPSAREREAGRMFLVAEARGPSGAAQRRMTLPDGSLFTAQAAVECTLRVARGEVAPGAQTPSRAFGADFVSKLPGVAVQTSAHALSPAAAHPGA